MGTSAQRARGRARPFTHTGARRCSWVVIAINQWDFEDERVLLLSNAALYRVKYKRDGQIERHERQPLGDVCRIQVGPLYHGKFTPAGLLAGSGDRQAQIGVRVYSERWRGASVFSRAQEFRTYRASAEAESPAAVAREIRDAILDTQEAYAMPRALVDDLEIKRDNLLGPISVVRNKLK